MEFVEVKVLVARVEKVGVGVNDQSTAGRIEAEGFVRKLYQEQKPGAPFVLMGQEESAVAALARLAGRPLYDKEMMRVLELGVVGRCRELQMQNCHECPKMDCGDNDSPAKQQIKMLQRQVDHLQQELKKQMEETDRLRTVERTARKLAERERDGAREKLAAVQGVLDSHGVIESSVYATAADRVALLVARLLEVEGDRCPVVGEALPKAGTLARVFLEEEQRKREAKDEPASKEAVEAFLDNFCPGEGKATAEALGVKEDGSFYRRCDACGKSFRGTIGNNLCAACNSVPF